MRVRVHVTQEYMELFNVKVLDVEYHLHLPVTRHLFLLQETKLEPIVLSQLEPIVISFVNQIGYLVV